MHNTKQIIVFAIVGFILSLVCGFFSNSNFLHILLIAVGWALGFAVLGFLISFVFKKFLTVEDFGETVSPSNNVLKSTSVGNNVDIVIEDKELDRTDSSNRYSVGDNRQMLNDSDFSTNDSTTTSVQSSNESSDFIPIRNLETYKNFSGTEAVSSDSISKLENIENVSNVSDTKNTSNNDINSSSTNDLDVLPDMGAFVIEGSKSDNEEDVEDIYGNSDSFSESSFTSSRTEQTDNENMQNTELIAKAISSVLSQET